MKKHTVKNRIDPTTFPYVEFVRDWNAAYSVGDVAERYSITNAQATGLAARLRRSGVDVKHMRPSLDAIADRINAKLEAGHA